MPEEKTLTVELTEREARSLVAVANIMGEAFEHSLARHMPGLLDGRVPPLVSASMKIEVEMVATGMDK